MTMEVVVGEGTENGWKVDSRDEDQTRVQVPEQTEGVSRKPEIDH